jgi:hypothetical protein|tara:strand:- start:20975 stop:21202 length:228 start_codon:yes stop_codon:yes gene_type:complete
MSKVKTGSTVIVKHYFKSPIFLAINILSVMVSWYFNKSVLWAIFHYVFGLMYLIYSMLIGRFADGGFMEIMNSYF